MDRAVSDSANLHLPWSVAGHGLLALSSGSLIERPEPYLVPLELARGTTVQIRNQLSEWQLIGLSVPAAVTLKLAEAVEQLSRAAVGQDNVAAAAGHAEQSLQAALEAGNLLAAAYTEQALAVRRRNGGRVPGLLAGELPPELLEGHASRQFAQAFNAAVVPLAWRETEATEGHFSWTTTDRQIQWCRAAGLKVLGGPLLPFDRLALPDWLSLFEDDFDSVLQFASVFARAAVARYRGNVDCWIAAGRINAAEELALSEQERLRLVARIVNLVRSVDRDTPVLASFDQPWGENLRQRRLGSPLAALRRRAGAHRPGPRRPDDRDECRLLARRHAAAAPRRVQPAGRYLERAGPAALVVVLRPERRRATIRSRGGRRSPVLAGWNPAAQRAFAARFVPLALAKPGVQGVVWSQTSDRQPHRFPHAGLFDAAGRAKPALAALAALRRGYLK